MKIKKIYLDMDGVLCNFESKFIELFGQGTLGMRDRKNFSTNWPRFIEEQQFKDLDWFPGGKELIDFIKDYPHIQIEILSSSGGLSYHEDVKKQKKHWLRKNGISYRANIVPGRSLKKDYASPDTILIDDTEDVINSFNRAGGIGILHKDIGETLTQLKTLLV
jgi:hypothetical protein